MVRVWKLEEANERKKGPTEIRTRVTGIRTLGDNQLHYRTSCSASSLDYIMYKASAIIFFGAFRRVSDVGKEQEIVFTAYRDRT